MRQLLPIFVLMTALTTAACAQDSVPPQEPGATQSRSGYDGYGGRAEVFVTGFGLFGNGTSGHAINQKETQSGGASVGYRFHLNAASALEGRYGFSRATRRSTRSAALYRLCLPTFLRSAPAMFTVCRNRAIYNRSSRAEEGWSSSFRAITAEAPRHQAR